MRKSLAISQLGNLREIIFDILKTTFNENFEIKTLTMKVTQMMKVRKKKNNKIQFKNQRKRNEKDFITH